MFNSSKFYNDVAIFFSYDTTMNANNDYKCTVITLSNYPMHIYTGPSSNYALIASRSRKNERFYKHHQTYIICRVCMSIS